MLADLAALGPPLIVAGAFLIGLILFLRHQMGTPARSADEDGGADIPDDSRNAADGDPASASTPDHGKV